MQWLLVTSFQIDFHIVCSICLFTAIVNRDAIVVVMIFRFSIEVEWSDNHQVNTCGGKLWLKADKRNAIYGSPGIVML